jgi:hypothetical protein
VVAKARIDICEDIKKDDEVEIIPNYSYMIGTNERIEEYFNVKPGEVVIKKTTKVGPKSNMAIIKCKRTDIIIEKK